MPPSPRLKIPVPIEADPPDGPTQMDAIVDVLDDAAIDRQGLLADRPAANAVPRGTYWFSTDTRQLSRSDGAAWTDVGSAGLAIGDVKASYQAADHPGWLLLDGRASVPRADHPADFVAMMLAAGYAGVDGTTFAVPDFRGRHPIGRGTHVEVDTLGDNDGLPVAQRKARHRHGRGSLAVQNGGAHGHAGAGLGFLYHSAVATNLFLRTSIEGDNRHVGMDQAVPGVGAHGHGLAGEIGDLDGPLEGAPFIVVNWFVYTGAAGPGNPGGPGGGGAGLAARETTPIATANIANAAHDVGSVALAPSVRVLRVAADRACRVRLYSTAADRDAAGEAARAGTTPPSGDHGVILDVEFAGAESLRLLPQALGSNYDGPVADAIYWRVTNLSGAAAVVNVTLDWQPLEPIV